ncbi:MAG: protein kinase domain-containing protein [Phycisphaeraceae bacterium]
MEELDSGTDDEHAPKPDQPVPGFTLAGLIGEGGMGLVYRATQHRPRRQVALKLLRPGVVSRRTLRRFEREAEILGRLQHPAIAQVYEAGVAPGRGAGADGDAEQSSGRPYFAMELVDGVDLKRYAERVGLSPRDRIGLFAEVCDAVHDAHERGVIHRDLKPANILIDNAGKPKVLDFGIARVTGSDHTLITMQTGVGQLLGTLPYMAPEQVVGDPDAADARTDVYALGVTLYELLAGRLPYDVNTASIPEAARIIRDEEPAPLSGTNRTLRGDIETIVGRCLAKEPDRRYPSARALAEDLRRYRSDRPIHARPPSSWYQATRFAKRNKALVAGLCAVFVTLALGMAGTALGRSNALRAQAREAEQRRIADQQRREAQAAAARAEANRRAIARALEQEKRMRALAQERSIASSIIGSFYRTLIGEFDPDIARQQDATQLRHMLAAGSREADAIGRLHPRTEVELRLSLAQGYARIGDAPQAAQQHARAYQVAADKLGPASHLTLHAKRGLILDQSNQTVTYTESIEHLRREQAVARRLEGFESGLYATLILDLSLVYYADRRVEAMVAMMDDYVPVIQAGGFLDPSSAQAFATRWSIGLTDLGRFDEAAPVLEWLLQLQEPQLGLRHTDTLNTAFNLAWSYIGINRPVDAIALLERALPAAVDLYERNPQRYRRMRRMLREAYFMAGRTADALDLADALYDEAYDRSGPDHPDTLIDRFHLAQVLMQDQRYEEALGHLRLLSEKNQANLGRYNLHTIRTRSGLARCYLALDQFDRARALYKDNVTRYTDLFGPDHVATLLARRYLAVCAGEANEYDKAIELGTRLLADARRALGDDDPVTAKIAVMVGRYTLSAGRPAEARDIILRWQDGLSRGNWSDAFFLYRTHRCLADALSALGEAEQAGQWRASAEQLHADWRFPIDRLDE